jgi:hypothetical protein
MLMVKKVKLFNNNFFLPTNSTNCSCYFLLECLYNTVTFDFMRVPMSSVNENRPIYFWQINGNLLYFSASSKIWRCLII